MSAILSRSGESDGRVVRTLDAGGGLHVDLDQNDAPMGIEITAPGAIRVAGLNAVLVGHGLAVLDDRASLGWNHRRAGTRNVKRSPAQRSSLAK
jgi:hypothetical protein